MDKKDTSQRIAKAFLYQWTEMDGDFYEYDKLGRLGGNGGAANKFRGIEDELRKNPSVPHWIIAARRHNGVWGLYALLKVRQPTDEEKRVLGAWDKYLYFDEAESGFLVLPGESPLVIEHIDRAIKNKIPAQTQTQGRNGTSIDISEGMIAELRRKTKVSIRARKEELHKEEASATGSPSVRATSTSGQSDTKSTGSGSDIAEDSVPPIPIEPERAPVVSANAQVSLESDTRSLKTDEREAVVKVRFGQGSFREALFEEKGYGEKCWMSGIEGGRLLIASHIKPWSHCGNDTDSRGRTENGLLLSALWDAAFDAGLLTFDPGWNVVASSKLSESARSALNLNAHSALPEMFRTDARKEYLAYHRATVFEYWTRRD